jgi:hypothetical protein
MKDIAHKLPRSVCLLALAILLNGCGGSTGRTPEPPQTAVAVSISPTSATLTPSQTQQFQVAVTGSGNTGVAWSVDNIAGGNASVGTISSSGLYTAPAVDGNHTVEVTSMADSTKTATAAVTVGTPQPIAVTISPTSVTLMPTQGQQFKATVTGTTNTAVTWSVDNIVGGNTSVGTISTGGLYTAPAAAGNHTVEVTSAADTSKTANATVSVVSAAASAVTTERYDSGRTGRNVAETILTPANVNSATFGKITSFPLDGITYTQPLYVPNLSIPGQGTFNVVFVATEHDSVYAFDADAMQSSPLWKQSFIDPANGITTVPQSDVGSTIFPEIGITGTPVIDLSTKTMYLVALTKENGNYVQRLHALDITTGQEKLGGPVIIQATVPGIGSGTDGNGNVPFQPKIQLQRAGLLLLNGVIYIAWGSHGDNGVYHGWVMAYDASDLGQLAVWNATPDGKAGAIWQSGAGLAADSNGTVYAVTGNGTFDASLGGTGYGDSIVALKLNGSTLSVSDYFSPFNQAVLSTDDSDVGSCGLTLIPGTRLGTAAGKDGSIYLVDLDNLGKFNAVDNSQIVQYLAFAIGTAAEDNNFSNATFFNGNVYYIGQSEFAFQYQLSGGMLSVSPMTESTNKFGHRGAQAVVSANGSTNAIMWAIEYLQGANGVLHAYDANNLATELYNSTQAGQRDVFGTGVRFSVPTVINGKVYVGAKAELAIFGNM